MTDEDLSIVPPTVPTTNGALSSHFQSSPVQGPNANLDRDILGYSDLLPQSLYNNVTTMSSRRPSYAAEFSSRPKLFSISEQPSLSPTSTTVPPAIGQQDCRSPWASRGSASIWSVGDNEPPAPAAFSGRNFRSVSFSHESYQQHMQKQHPIQLPPTQPQSQSQPQPQPQHNFMPIGVPLAPSLTSTPGSTSSSSSIWFNTNNANSNRRHSFATISSTGSGNSGNHPVHALPSAISQVPHEELETDFDMKSIHDYFENKSHPSNFDPLDDNIEDDSQPLNIILLSNSQATSTLYFVEFKNSRTDVFYGPSSGYKVNDLVIVDADRGLDLGKITAIQVPLNKANRLKFRQFMDQHNALSATSNNSGTSHDTAPPLFTPKKIIRKASAQEISQILTKSEQEMKALKICQLKLTEKHLQMVLIDAEFQFDKRKLTFFYFSNFRIDFRDLVKDLFKIYKTRIWMCAVQLNEQNPEQLLWGQPTSHTNQSLHLQQNHTHQSIPGLPPPPSSHMIYQSNTSPIQQQLPQFSMFGRPQNLDGQYF